MCYKVPLLWIPCGHTYGYSPVHCTAAKALHLEPTEHCEHLMDAEDPNWKIKKDMLCPECQVKPAEATEPETEEAVAEEEKGKGTENMGIEEQALAAELAHLESLLEEHELADYETALQASLHHHTLQHETHLEQAKSASLADAPEHHVNPQSLETYMADVARAREESQRHWEEELGMGVYRDHERAVQRARVESYRELLEGYRRAKEGRTEEENEESGGRGAIESRPGSTTSMSTTKATAGSSSGNGKRRWPFQDDVEDDNETIAGSRACSLSSRHFSNLSSSASSRRFRGPPEKELLRTLQKASLDDARLAATRARLSQQSAGDETSWRDGRQQTGDDGDVGRRRRSLLRMFHHGGGGSDRKRR